MKAIQDVFRMRMSIPKFMPIAHWWTFRVCYSKIHIQVERCSNHDQLASGIPHRNEELMFQFFVQSARVVNRIENHDDTVADKYDCEFYMNKVGSHDNNSWAVRVEGKLSPLFGFRGKWFHHAKSDYSLWNDSFASSAWLILRATNVQVTVEEVPTPLTPLTCGVYQFAGNVAVANRHTRTLEITVTLMPQGRLVGTVATINHREGRSIRGFWSIDELEMAEETTNECEERLAFLLNVNRYAITGKCELVPSSCDLNELFNEWRPRRRARTKAGSRVEMNATVVRRLWNTGDHYLYPVAFRKAVLLCVLWAASETTTTPEPRLPRKIWLRVFEFCDFEWFACAHG